MLAKVTEGAILGMPDYPANVGPSFVVAYYVPPMPASGPGVWRMETSQRGCDPCPLWFSHSGPYMYAEAAKRVRGNDYLIAVVLRVSHLPIPGPEGHDPRGLPMVTVYAVERHPLVGTGNDPEPDLDAAPLLAELSAWYINGESAPADLPDELVQGSAECFTQVLAMTAGESWEAACARDVTGTMLTDGAGRLADDGSPHAGNIDDGSVPSEADILKARNREVVYGKDRAADVPADSGPGDVRPAHGGYADPM